MFDRLKKKATEAVKKAVTEEVTAKAADVKEDILPAIGTIVKVISIVVPMLHGSEPHDKDFEIHSEWIEIILKEDMFNV